MRCSAAVATSVVLGLCLLGCQAKEAPEAEAEQEKTGLAGQFDRTITDRDVMREAVDAANEVVRNAADCEAARAALPDAQAKLDEALEKIQTPAGRASLESLQKSLDRIDEACP